MSGPPTLQLLSHSSVIVYLQVHAPRRPPPRGSRQRSRPASRPRRSLPPPWGSPAMSTRPRLVVTGSARVTPPSGLVGGAFGALDSSPQPKARRNAVEAQRVQSYRLMVAPRFVVAMARPSPSPTGTTIGAGQLSRFFRWRGGARPYREPLGRCAAGGEGCRPPGDHPYLNCSAICRRVRGFSRNLFRTSFSRARRSSTAFVQSK